MSTARETLLEETENAPEEILRSAIDYVRFLKSRHFGEENEPLLLAESALAKDWLRPEEDEAWKDL